MATRPRISRRSVFISATSSPTARRRSCIPNRKRPIHCRSTVSGRSDMGNLHYSPYLAPAFSESDASAAFDQIESPLRLVIDRSRGWTICLGCRVIGWRFQERDAVRPLLQRCPQLAAAFLLVFAVRLAAAAPVPAPLAPPDTLELQRIAA